MLRLILISDMNGLHYKMRHPISEGDVLIHAGDLLDAGIVDVRGFDGWVGSLGFKHVITIAGNHERKWDLTERASLGAVFQNVHYSGLVDKHRRN